MQVNQMPRIDADELEILTAFDQGQLKSVATKTEFAKLKAAARATAIKDRRGYASLSSETGRRAELQPAKRRTQSGS